MDGIRIGTTQFGEEVWAREDMLQRHTLLFGSTGYGKTSLAHLLIREQMARGASLVAIDPEPSSLGSLRALCQDADVPPERVVALDPSDPAHVPPFNPFRSSIPPMEVVSKVFDLLASTENAPRVQEYVLNALVVAAWHGLPLDGVMRLLRDDDYREAVLRSETVHPYDELYQRSVDYLEKDFGPQLPQERQSTVTSSGLRLNRLTDHLFFLRGFNADSNDVDFARLFTEQGAVLANLGNGTGLRDDSRRFLGTLLVRLLDAASASADGDRPVILAIDEAAFLLPLIEGAVKDIVNMARKRDIRLVISTQYPGDIPASLQGALKTNSQVKAFFHDSGDEAQATARYVRSQAASDLPALPLPVTEKKMALLSPRWDTKADHPLPFAAYWDGKDRDLPPHLPLRVRKGEAAKAIKDFVSWAYGHNPPVRLEDGQDAQEVFDAMPDGSVRLVWQRNGKRFYGYALFDPPEPPKPLPESYWLNRIRTLDIQEAVVIVGSDPPKECRIDPVATRRDADGWYVAESRDRYYRAPPRKPKPEEERTEETKPEPGQEPERRQPRETRSGW